jgi:hypothetical protein
MVCALWDRKGVLLVEFMQQSTTVIAQVYYGTLNIQNKSILTGCCLAALYTALISLHPIYLPEELVRITMLQN